MLVIGENINASNRSVAEAIVRRDDEFFTNLARAEAQAGADFVDVNAGSGYGSLQETIAAIRWLVGIVQSAIDKPLAIDSDAPEMIEAALEEYEGDRVIINSVTAEPLRLQSIGPLVAERNAWVVALAMGAEGIPALVEERADNISMSTQGPRNAWALVPSTRHQPIWILPALLCPRHTQVSRPLSASYCPNNQCEAGSGHSGAARQRVLSLRHVGQATQQHAQEPMTRFRRQQHQHGKH